MHVITHISVVHTVTTKIFSLHYYTLQLFFLRIFHSFSTLDMASITLLKRLIGISSQQGSINDTHPFSSILYRTNSCLRMSVDFFFLMTFSFSLERFNIIIFVEMDIIHRLHIIFLNYYIYSVLLHNNFLYHQ